MHCIRLFRMIYPGRLPCGHSFCTPCIGLIPDHLCPNCRTPFGADRISSCLLSTKLLSKLGLGTNSHIKEKGRAKEPGVVAKELLEFEGNQLIFPSCMVSVILCTSLLIDEESGMMKRLLTSPFVDAEIRKRWFNSGIQSCHNILSR